MSFHSTHTTVLVEDVRLDAFVGQHVSERDELQVLSVSIACTLKNPDVTDDNLENTFDYVPVITQLRTFAIERKRRLIETFAEEIAEACFAYPHVRSATISVRKPNKFSAVAAVGITRTFERRV